MANDRMWLVHIPTGKKTLLAKHFGTEWAKYRGPVHNPYYSLEQLFEVTGSCSRDFVIEYDD
jgi:hypothetical protein